MKEYYFMLERTDAPTHITLPYISQATGSLCVTLSARYHDAGNVPMILCIDTNLMGDPRLASFTPFT